MALVPPLPRPRRAILCAYAILLVGALLLYWVESQNEINHACASRAEDESRQGEHAVTACAFHRSWMTSAWRMGLGMGR